MSWWPISYCKQIKWILIKYIELFVARQKNSMDMDEISIVQELNWFEYRVD